MKDAGVVIRLFLLAEAASFIGILLVLVWGLSVAARARSSR
jgi:hypothetical protein